MSLIKGLKLFCILVLLPALTETSKNSLYEYTSQEESDVRSADDPMNSMFVPLEFPAGQIPLLNRKIYRGMRVTVREHPYVVSIRRLYAHYLTGSLLTKNVIITTADPVYNVPTVELRVVVGENYSDRGTTLHTVLLVVVHQKFNPETLRANLAMLRVYEDVAISGAAKPIGLVSPTFSPGGHTAFVTGWGRCDRTGKELCLGRSNVYFRNEKLDPMLRTVSFVMEETTNPRCDWYQDIGLSSDMMCMGPAREDERQAACSAVPGAPLVVHARLAGLLSWGFGCGYVKDLPLIYTSVLAHIKWIVHNIAKFKKIQKSDLAEIFEITKAQGLYLWQTQTRFEAPLFGTPHQTDIKPLKVDHDLFLLKGQIFDARDFLYYGKYQKAKKLMYDNIKMAHKRKTKLKNNSTPIIRLHAFLSNETLSEVGISFTNGSVIEIRPGDERDIGDEVISDVLTTVNETVTEPYSDVYYE